MKISKIPVIALVVLLTSCDVDFEQFATYDVYYKNAFVTQENVVLESSALYDSCLYVSDCEISIQGGFEYAADDIVKYGHCWVKGNYEPTINSDSSNCTFFETFVNTGDKFRSKITNLQYETSYSIRSFVITRSGKVGYNPEITGITTSIPHDKWFDSGLLDGGNGPISQRADGVNVVAVIDGDTLTYFGLGRDGSSCFSDFYCYSSKNKQFTQLSDFPIRVWGASGFFLDNYDENHIHIQRIYVGTGCTKADQYSRSDYSNKFFVYNIEKNKWDEVVFYYEGELIAYEAFQGQSRTGATSFCLHGFGFIGLGEWNNNGTLAYHNDFYTFVMDKDERGYPAPERGMFKPMTAIFPYGKRSGVAVAVSDDIAYLAGGVGPNKQYSNDFLTCDFTPPVSGSPESYTFTWNKINRDGNDKAQIPESFKPRSYGVAFAIQGNVYYGTGENNENRFSDFIKYERSSGRILKCADYKNGSATEENKEISRAFAITAGDRAFVGGGKINGNYINTQWVYRP